MSLYLFSWDFPETRTLKSFILFLFCSLAIWIGNALIMISSTSSQLIEQPMHFFLNYLSLCDLSYTSIVIPKLITDLLAERKTISCRHYMAQLFTMHFFGGIEIFILTGMAYDHSMAICKPLHYTVVMSRLKCNTIIIASCTRGTYTLCQSISPHHLFTNLWPQYD